MGIPLVGARTTVRAATDADAPLLAGWHADPEVAHYWDDETFTVDEVRERMARADVDAWIVEEDGEPVGYLQSWRDSDSAGLDGFLVPSARGRGLMPDAARVLTEALLAAGWPEVTVDPYSWNDRAVRAWEKAGFVEVSRHPPDAEHAHDWILMRFAATLRA